MMPPKGNKLNIVVCEDPDKEVVMARIKNKCTQFVGLVDDYAFYPNGYPTYMVRRGSERGAAVR